MSHQKGKMVNCDYVLTKNMEVQWCFSQLCYCIPQTPFCFGNFLLEISTDSHFPLCFCYFYDGIEKRIRFEIGLFEPLET